MEIEDYLKWFQDGAHLDTATGIATLAAALRFFVVPTVKSAAKRFGIALSARMLLVIVYLLAAIGAFGIGIIFEAPLTVQQVLIVAGAAANTAIGLHTTGKAMKVTTNETNTGES